MIIVKPIDRHGRNYDEIIEQGRAITKEKDVDIKVVDMQLLDTQQGRDCRHCATWSKLHTKM